MKPSDLNAIPLADWSRYLREFSSEHERRDEDAVPAAVRCENSQLSLGWKCGAFTANGRRYRALCPEGAMLAVSEELIAWVKRRRTEEQTARRRAADERQLGLGI